MKRIFALLLTLTLIVSLPVSANAENEKYKVRQIEIDQLMDQGATQAEANRILKTEKILDKLDDKNLHITVGKNGYDIDSNGLNLEDVLSKSEIKHLERALANINESQSLKASISEKKVQSVNDEFKKMMEENPGRSKYRIDYPDGSWQQMEIGMTLIDSIEDTKVNTYASYKEDELSREYFPLNYDGNHRYECVAKVTTGGTDFAFSSWVKEYITISNNGDRIEVYATTGGSSANGYASLSSTETEELVTDTDMNENPTVWCWVQEKAIISTRVGFSFAAFGQNFNVGGGIEFMNYAVIKTSLAGVHRYHGIYA